MQKTKNILRKLGLLIFGVSWIVWLASIVVEMKMQYKATTPAVYE